MHILFHGNSSLKLPKGLLTPQRKCESPSQRLKYSSGTALFHLCLIEYAQTNDAAAALMQSYRSPTTNKIPKQITPPSSGHCPLVVHQ